MMPTKRHNGHRNDGGPIDPFVNLAVHIIIDAIFTTTGKTQASAKERAEASRWLQGETCRRWAWVCGVDIQAAMERKDSLVKRGLNGN